jgi:flavorubredoxin
VNLEFCTGCLRCNLIKRCAIKGDEWSELSEKILDADTLVFGSPVYFHHVTAPLKKIIDRFRSFLHVRMTETGLIHTPWHEWKKHFVLILSLGNAVTDDARPVVDLLEFMVGVLGTGNRLTTIIGTGLGRAGQVAMSEEELRQFYIKIKMPEHLAPVHHRRNRELLHACYEMGKKLGNVKC